MLKINNALIIDDEINLISDNQTTNSIQNNSYKSLINLHNYFLNNSIPISIITDLGNSPGDALEKITNIPRPDIVVMDLDLNSDGEVGDDDINLIGITLKKIHDTFGEFILFIYSSQAEDWSTIMPSILAENESLSNILKIENTIILEKFVESSAAINERIAYEIEIKKNRYFEYLLANVDRVVEKMWNKEILIIGFMMSALCIIFHYSFEENDNNVLYFAILIITITTFTFIKTRINNNSKQLKNGCS